MVSKLLLRWGRAGSRGRGQALVEMALILPMFLFLMMGILQVAALAMVWISLQGITQDMARWMAVSSPNASTGALPAYNSDCSANTTLHVYPRPRWADGDDGLNYLRCNASSPLLRGANFSAPTWSPACTNGTDCAAAGLRRADGTLSVTMTYNWSNMIFIPSGLRGWFNWVLPANATATAAEVMQY
ncbi:MAG TPA: TadE family protein [Chloroflexota bacterium]|jgi:hypothetical protein